MSPCEQSAEPGCTSPRMFMADGVEELGDSTLGEGFVECAVEPLSSLDVSSPVTDRGVDDCNLEFVAQQNCCSDLGGRIGDTGVKDGSMTNDCNVSSHCVRNSEAADERDDLGCADGAEEVVCGSLSERVHELVLNPLSGLDISYQAPSDEKDAVLVSSYVEGFCNLDEGRDRNARDVAPILAHTDTEFEPIIERHEAKGGYSDDNSEFGNVSSIKCRLNKVSLDEGQCEREMNLCFFNPTDDGQVPLRKQQVAGAQSGSTVLYMSDTDAGCDNLIGRILEEAACTGTIDNGASKSFMMPDTSRLNECVPAPSSSNAVESFNHAGNTGMDKSGTDGASCEWKCLNASSLPLRRSSRSKSSVQQVQRGKNASKCTKKASNVSLRPNVDLLSEAIRKKRSSLSRSVCSSVWGMPENLSKYFHLSNKVAVNSVMDQRSRKKKAGQKSRKKSMPKGVASSQFSEARQEVPSRPIRLKVTFGKKEGLSKVSDLPPAVVDSLPGLHSVNDNKQLSFCSYMESSGGNITDVSVPTEMPSLVQCSNSTSNVEFAGANLENCSASGKYNHEDSSQLEYEKQDSSCADKFSNPGTSPDSEVIDQVLGSTVGPMVPIPLTSLHDFVNKAYCGNVCPKNHAIPASLKKSKNRNKKDKLCQGSNLVQDCQHSADRTKLSKKDGQLPKLSDKFCSVDNINAEIENPPSNTSGSELLSTELLPVAHEGFNSPQSLDAGADISTNSRMVVGIESVESGNSCQVLPPTETVGKRNSKGSRNKGKPRSKSKITDAITSQKVISSIRKMKLASKHKVDETGILGEPYKIKGQPRTGIYDVGETDSGDKVILERASCLDTDVVVTGVVEQTLAPRVAWVCCDDCLKWRCIPAELADIIEETNCRWTCKDNQDQAFADCSIPQGKSNAEINAELQISDEEDARDGHLGSRDSGLRQLVASQPSTWMLIKFNLFLHRSRKAQTVDEIMVCHCKPPVDGSVGCGSQCLNRMLNIECVQGTCPCGDVCSNQQFQKRQYVMLSWFRCGKKGYGLQVLEDISEGQFLIEYVGEVLDLPSYEARQKDYALKGHKHFYFMTLNGNEVIDASTKGNLGRFVNHSCDPNCCTEKWVVNGEICVGLFALRNIKKGEELTFDYNYVRVFGAAAKKCHCGSRKCRGYIGGDPLNAQGIVQGDSDEEFPEPVVVNENGEIDHSLEERMAKSSSQDVERGLTGDNINEESSDIIVEAGDLINKLESSIDDVEQSLTVLERVTIDEVRESTDSSTGLQSENFRNQSISAVQNHTLKTEHLMSTPTSSPKSDILPVENTMQKSLTGSIDSSGRVTEVYAACELPHARPRPRTKISRLPKSVKNRKSSGSSATVGKAVLTAPKSKMSSYKPKKLLEGSANGHREAVEEKLNELLDSDGGICKKKDASKGYLKLLLLTAASGDSGNGGAIQSNRDLSMILDAMLKTKSRGVLLDVINKNGLQMLHNMMKLYRRDFKKIPILRKLLKVLEFLAEKEILTVERVNGDSLHPGVESLRESILFFTNHKDNQVHQIARNFRDRWIPHPLRKFSRMGKNDRWREFHRGSNSNRFFGACHRWRELAAMAPECIPCSDQSGTVNNLADARTQEASSSHLTGDQTIVTRPRRRKSRWDQPAYSSSPKKFRTSPKIEISGGETLAIEGREEERDCSGAQSFPKHGEKGTDDVMKISDDDAPPGFSYPRDAVVDSPPGFSSSLKCSSVSLGIHQQRFNPRLPVAYGIPFSVVQHFGTVQCGTVDSWAIAPAMPFQPFPPLPPYPRDRRQIGDQEEVRQDNHLRACEQSDQGIPSTSGAGVSQTTHTATANQNTLHHDKGLQNFPGKRYHRQKRWSNQKLRPPPWFRNLDGWGFKGKYSPHFRNGSFDINMDTVDEPIDQHLADVNHSVEYAHNSC